MVEPMLAICLLLEEVFLDRRSSTALLVSIRSALQDLCEEELFRCFDKSNALAKRLEPNRFGETNKAVLEARILECALLFQKANEWFEREAHATRCDDRLREDHGSAS